MYRSSGSSDPPWQHSQLYKLEQASTHALKAVLQSVDCQVTEQEKHHSQIP